MEPRARDPPLLNKTDLALPRSRDSCPRVESREPENRRLYFRELIIIWRRLNVPLRSDGGGCGSPRRPLAAHEVMAPASADHSVMSSVWHRARGYDAI